MPKKKNKPIERFDCPNCCQANMVQFKANALFDHREVKQCPRCGFFISLDDGKYHYPKFYAC